MPWAGFIAVGSGAAIGAWLRWGLGIVLNPIFPALPLGTLAANLVGGFLMGVAMEYAAIHTNLSPEMRLLATTGFLGGLTTFSTFSGEMTVLLARRDFAYAALGITVHVAGSILLTLLGIAAARALFAGTPP
jgi:CrcB protein